MVALSKYCMGLFTTMSDMTPLSSRWERPADWKTGRNAQFLSAVKAQRGNV
jgi:hypothetical protein